MYWMYHVVIKKNYVEQNIPISHTLACHKTLHHFSQNYKASRPINHIQCHEDQ